MRSPEELIDVLDPAFPLLREWAAGAPHPVEILPPSEQRRDVLLHAQVTTRSALGAVAYETGGVLVDHGWLRLLGSGHPKLTRTLPGWNEGRAGGLYLVADDAAGGFYAMNGGALGDDVGSVYYFAPDTLAWEPMGRGYTDLVHWALTQDLSEFYEGLRWPGWEADTRQLHGDQAFLFVPPLFTREGRGAGANRHPIAIAEAWSVQMSYAEQLGVEPRQTTDRERAPGGE